MAVAAVAVVAAVVAAARGVQGDVAARVRELSDSAQRIIQFATHGNGTGETYARVAEYVDTFGARLCGSEALERSIDYLERQLRDDGLENVHTEPAMVPKWVRGEEWLHLVSPRPAVLHMLGLGGSVGTGGVLTADAIVVRDQADLQAHAARNHTQGRIIVFNFACDWTPDPFACYNNFVRYRGRGAIWAAQAGGVAALVRSLASGSIASPHTGLMHYDNSVPAVASAAIATEDADMLQRMQDRGSALRLSLFMNATSYGLVPSRNLIAEWTGSKYPNQTVLVSGHLDSWDVGQGAMDDAGGAVVSWQVLSFLRRLNIRPLRTIRLVLWVGEEWGGVGGDEYYAQHRAEAGNMSVVMESDLGNFQPLGVGITGSPSAIAIMKQIAQLAAPINASRVIEGGEGTDVAKWNNIDGVPLVGLVTVLDRYFLYHHSQGDTMSVLDSAQLDLNAATWTLYALGVASLDELLPRPIPAASSSSASAPTAESSTASPNPSTAASNPSTTAANSSTAASNPSTAAANPSTTASNPSTAASNPSTAASNPSTAAANSSTVPANTTTPACGAGGAGCGGSSGLGGGVITAIVVGSVMGACALAAAAAWLCLRAAGRATQDAPTKGTCSMVTPLAPRTTASAIADRQVTA